MEEISPTRTELLAKKTQIKLADEGKDLLKQKQDALLIEFMSLMDKVLSASQKLESVAKNAQYALTLAKAVDGVVSIKSVSFATKGEVTIDISGSYVMGVPVPEVKKKSVSRSILTRGYSVTGVSSRIDETAERFEEEVNVIIEIAAIETKLRRLGEEIQKTRRRVNALEHIVIPALKDQVKYIQMVLEERAREDLFRLKKVKKSIEKKKKSA
ncbi:MAG: V-type ATP synthase subunit D [Actinobacteria bacterium]|nr:V-type ATP synthase subunit D [Actinomycetota bacterium]